MHSPRPEVSASACSVPALAVSSPRAHTHPRRARQMYTTIIGMFALPWLLLAIPGLGDMLHQMRPTGFDEAGGLQLVMTLQQMKRKQKKLAMAGRLSEQEQALLNSVCRARARTPRLADQQVCY